MKKVKLFIILLPLFSNLVFSQGLINNGAEIFITSSSTLYIVGGANANFTNQTSGANHGAIDLDGVMYVEGNWTNNATSGNVFINIATPDGTVELKGATTQTIGGTATTTFENLTINNTAAGDAISLSVNAIVEGTLTLTDGVVVTGANYLILESTNYADLQPATPTDVSFINGNLRRYITENTDTYAFPCGNGTSTTNFYLVELINRNLTGINYIDGKFGALVGGGKLNVTEEGTPYTSVATEGVWYLDTNAAPTGGMYDLKCYIANFADLSDNEFTILSRPSNSSDAANWVCTPCEIGVGLNANNGAGRMVIDGYALRKGFTSFSQFGIGILSAPLPIELLNFSASCNNNIVQLNWSTSSETNNDYFTIEKCKDDACIVSNNWEELTTVNGAGFSNEILSYSCTDNAPYSCINYYRLIQTDYDGNYEYLEITVTNCGSNFIDLINIFPNPAKNSFEFEVFSTLDTDVYTYVIDALGKIVISKQFSIQTGINKLSLNVPDLSSACYVLKVETVSGLYKDEMHILINK